mgnify:FL=1
MFDEDCKQKRAFIKTIAQNVLELRNHSVFNEEQEQGKLRDHGEMTANIMLAYRHLEDAAMRLGKVIQAFDGGKSIYDK